MNIDNVHVNVLEGWVYGLGGGWCLLLLGEDPLIREVILKDTMMGRGTRGCVGI